MAKLAGDIWDRIQLSLKNFPLFEYYWKIFLFDLKQMVNSMFYACLVNEKPEIINFTENSIHTASNMIIYLYIDVDLMASPDFDVKELGLLREMLWYIQQMARIGNWITTWKRELKVRDFSSGVFALAVSKGVLSAEELGRMREDEIVRRIEKSGVMDYMLDLWKENYRRAFEMALKFKSFNARDFVRGLENLMKFHLASEGYK